MSTDKRDPKAEPVIRKADPTVRPVMPGGEANQEVSNPDEMRADDSKRAHDPGGPKDQGAAEQE